MLREWLTQQDRGLSLGYVGLFAILIVGALLYTMLNPAASAVFDFSSDRATTTQGQDVIDERRNIWSNILMYPMFIGALFILTRAAVEARRPG